MVHCWDYTNSTSTYWPTATSGTQNVGGFNHSTSNSSTGRIYTGTASTSSTAYGYNYVLVVERYLVSVPAHWSKEDRADFAYLVNDATKTGFNIEMFIDGDIEITDPHVHRRDMEEFFPLLLRHASHEDQRTIRDFFAAHSITPPDAAA